MGSGEVAIVALSTMISLKVTFSDGLGGGNKKVLQNVACFIENKDICSYKTKANLQKTKKTTRYGYNEEII